MRKWILAVLIFLPKASLASQGGGINLTPDPRAVLKTTATATLPWTFLSSVTFNSPLMMINGVPYTWPNANGVGCFKNDGTGIISFGTCGSGSGGGGGGGGVQIGAPYEVTVSTLLFPRGEFNVTSDGSGASTVTWRGSSGTITATQVAGSSWVFKNFVDISSNVRITNGQLIVGTQTAPGMLVFSTAPGYIGELVRISTGETLLFKMTSSSAEITLPQGIRLSSALVTNDLTVGSKYFGRPYNDLSNCTYCFDTGGLGFNGSGGAGGSASFISGGIIHMTWGNDFVSMGANTILRGGNGTVGAPTFTFTNRVGAGLYLSNAKDLALTNNSKDAQRWFDGGGSNVISSFTAGSIVSFTSAAAFGEITSTTGFIGASSTMAYANFSGSVTIGTGLELKQWMSTMSARSVFTSTLPMIMIPVSAAAMRGRPVQFGASESNFGVTITTNPGATADGDGLLTLDYFSFSPSSRQYATFQFSLSSGGSNGWLIGSTMSWTYSGFVSSGATTGKQVSLALQLTCLGGKSNIQTTAWGSSQTVNIPDITSNFAMYDSTQSASIISGGTCFGGSTIVGRVSRSALDGWDNLSGATGSFFNLTGLNIYYRQSDLAMNEAFLR